jgi:pimeloyl-ACP methyl ester carboxylesterase
MKRRARTDTPPRLRVFFHGENGAGSTRVLFIHGAWHASWTWENWLPLFSSRGYSPIAVDLRGHGASEGSYRDACLRDYVDDVARVVEDLDERPIVVGHSLGGLVVQHLIAGETFPAAVLVASIPGRYPPQVMLRFGLRHPLIMAQANLQRDLGALVKTADLVRESLFTEQTPEDVVVSCQSRLTGAAPALFREMVQSAPDPPRPGTPTLVIGAGKDPSFTVRLQRRLADRLGADFAEVEGSGHDVPLDLYWLEAAHLVIEWLEGQRLGARRIGASNDGRVDSDVTRTP